MAQICNDVHVLALHIAPLFFAVIPKRVVAIVITPFLIVGVACRVVCAHERPPSTLRIVVIVAVVAYVDSKVLEPRLLAITPFIVVLIVVLYEQNGMDEVSLVQLDAENVEVIRCGQNSLICNET